MPTPTFICKPFGELTTHELYALLRLRSEIFVVEQHCVYQDVDGYDQQAMHLLMNISGELKAYSRLIPPGLKYESASLGRVVTSKTVRGGGYGKALMIESIKQCKAHWPDAAVTISAQAYLEKFYRELGFKSESEPYLEDDIPHIQMRLERA
ncbi:MAG: GNAT family N-acetyltransferase [Pseudohongiellaceae bacterium]